ncbi:RNA polymerase sigma factor [Psychroflexus sp. ALD_RP9]|uniref:RNA polymerase sigma factor n=1 Tax=Psychroflexus sp. ALD_RP9 TaxID=2777186 RepID=UPI001A8F104A|nr:sigma-70 family RNA polymerase sigma factor [Psychroflexus sp. ALD_RP9]QSS98197.1 sigma-70 family RNA polymerase sigma factor [Psychroflexus sp. ALD_RP9]
MILKKLIKQCQNNNIEAQKQLYLLYADKFFGICLKYSSNHAQAQDNLQDAFITIFEKIKQFKHKGSFEGWMKRIVVNTALQKYKQQKVFELIAPNAIQDDHYIVEDLPKLELNELLALIQELPDRYRLVFNLYVLDGYSHAEIAECLSISDGTSKSNLSRARAILKTKVETLRQQKANKQA